MNKKIKITKEDKRNEGGGVQIKIIMQLNLSKNYRVQR